MDKGGIAPDTWSVHLKQYKSELLEKFDSVDFFDMVKTKEEMSIADRFCLPVGIDRVDRLFHLPFAFFLFIGRKTCRFCRSFATILLEFLSCPEMSKSFMPCFYYDTIKTEIPPIFAKVHTTVPMLWFYSPIALTHYQNLKDCSDKVEMPHWYLYHNESARTVKDLKDIFCTRFFAKEYNFAERMFSMLSNPSPSSSSSSIDEEDEQQHSNTSRSDGSSSSVSDECSSSSASSSGCSSSQCSQDSSDDDDDDDDEDDDKSDKSL